MIGFVTEILSTVLLLRLKTKPAKIVFASVFR